jgi:hypothetical protein
MSTTEHCGGVPVTWLAVLAATAVEAVLLEVIWGAPWQWMATTITLFAFGWFTPLLIDLAHRLARPSELKIRPEVSPETMEAYLRAAGKANPFADPGARVAPDVVEDRAAGGHTGGSDRCSRGRHGGCPASAASRRPCAR